MAREKARVKQPLTTFTCKLSEVQGKALAALLRGMNFEFHELPYAKFAAGKEKVNVVLYESGKLVVQGKGTQEFVEFVLEPQVLGEARLGYEAVLNPELYTPRIGIDESGKGDFFGPLCVAGVYVNETVIKGWEGAGIRDSKAIGSDRRIGELAKVIRQTEGCVHTVVVMGNEAYNRLFRKLKSVNAMLAWGHARAIENLLGWQYKMQPPPRRAISDQFAQSKGVVEAALMRLGRDLELVQRHKAEADMAVAAASILARDEFVTRLRKMEALYGQAFPKGASPAVEEAAREYLAKHGGDELEKVAKVHFRTAYRVQGLPEPPRVEWKRVGPSKNRRENH